MQNLSISVLMAIFPGEPGLAVLVELRMTEVMVTVTTGVISCAKFQSNRHHQQANTECFTGRSPSCQTQPTVLQHLRKMGSVK